MARQDSTINAIIHVFVSLFLYTSTENTIIRVTGTLN